MTTLAQRHPNALMIGTSLPLLILSFVLVHWLKYGDPSLSGKAVGLLLLLVGSWLIINLVLNLPQRLLKAPLPKGMAVLTKATLALLFAASLVVQLLGWGALPRLLVYGPGLLLAAGLASAYFLWRYFVPAADTEQAQPAKYRWRPLSFQLLFLDGFLLLGCYGAAKRLFNHVGFIDSSLADTSILLLGLWLATALLTGKFQRSNFQNLLEALVPVLKSLALMGGGLAFIGYGLRLSSISEGHIFGTLLGYALLEVPLFWLYVRYRKLRTEPQDIDDVAGVAQFLKQKQKDIPQLDLPAVKESAEAKVRQAVAERYPRDYRFIRTAIDLESIDRSWCTILDTATLANLETIDQPHTRLLINLHKMNDIRWFNRYFLTAHSCLEAGGYLVGNALTIATNWRYFTYRYPRPFAALFYTIYFIWHRMCPKLPWVQKMYFAITKGRNRQVSRAEILGRLYFCGFKIVAEQEIGHRFYFVAQKVKEPSYDENPTYGPLIRLRRFGQEGRPLEVLKFRTMFSYAEYLQEYVYENQQLDQGGKFKNDFRVTVWGRFMRRTWLDELPMIWNWLKGDMQLIGVRPLSAQYLSLYSEEVRDLRAKVKPGLLPPFYADMPKTLEDIMASEERYIRAYLERPLATQWRYFWQCFANIVLRGKRSQ